MFLHLFFHLTVNLCSSFSCLPHEYSKTHTLRSLQLHLERLTCWLNDSKPQRLQGSWSLQFSEKAIDIVLPTNGLFTGSSFVKSQHRRPNSMNHRLLPGCSKRILLTSWTRPLCHHTGKTGANTRKSPVKYQNSLLSFVYETFGVTSKNWLRNYLLRNEVHKT